MAKQQEQMQSGAEGPTEAWRSIPVQCRGGLVLNVDALTQGTTQPGSAKILQNFEPALEGGYRRINGYTKWDAATVPGDASAPILGCKVALGGVFAARQVSATPTTDIYFSTGSGWGTRINGSNRGGNPTRVRMHEYFLGAPKIVGVDGVNNAFTYDGATYTLLNSTGSPSNPKYVEYFNQRLVFAGYTNNAGKNAITLTSPVTDNDFNAANGAIEIVIGDEITGIKVFRNSLYIFTLNGIYQLTGNDASSFAISTITTEIGCINGDTIQEIGGDLIYLSSDGFRSVAGTYNIGDVDLSLQSRSIQPIVRANIVGNTGITQYVSLPVRGKSQYRCLFYDSSIAKANALGIIGKIEQGSPLQAFNYIYTSYTWSTTVGIQAYSGDSMIDNGVERVIIGDPSNGYVYQLESGNDFDGTAIQAIYLSPYLTFNDASLRKVLQKTTIYTEFEGTNSITLGVLFDFQDPSVLQPVSQALILTGNSFTYGGSGSLYGTAAYSAIQFPIFKKNLIGSGFTAAFQFSSIGGASFRIDSYQVTYSVKGRR